MCQTLPPKLSGPFPCLRGHLRADDSGKEHLGTLGLGLPLLTPQRPRQRRLWCRHCSRLHKGAAGRFGFWKIEGGQGQSNGRGRTEVGSWVPHPGCGQDQSDPTRLGPPGLGFQDGEAKGGWAASSTGASLCCAPGTTQEQALRASTNHPPHATLQAELGFQT